MASSRHVLCSVAALACALFGWVTPADAQIYSWRDSNGRLVLSDKLPPSAESVQSYPVPGTEEIRTLRDLPRVRTAAYDDLIVEQARLKGVRQSLVRAVIEVESGFNPLATSEKGAMGLMQLMPATARQFGVRNPYNPAENVRGGVSYLRELLDRYGDREELALAAYNAGPGAVDRHSQAIPPYRETKDYVVKVSGIAGKPTTEGQFQLYRTVEIIDGREVVKYSDRKPE